MDPFTPIVRCEAPRVKTRRPVSTEPIGVESSCAVPVVVIASSSPLA
jgi:hypothetical protein